MNSIKRLLPALAMALAMAMGVSAMDARRASTVPPQTSSAPPQDASSKVVKDPTEFNTYMTALNTVDPAKKAAAMESFINQYPNSVVKTDAMEQAMGAYQAAGNAAKVLGMARRLLQIDPNHIRALAILTAIDRMTATRQGLASSPEFKEVCASAQKGLQALPAWTKQEGMSDGDFQTLKNQMADIFNGAAGYCALQNRDYAAARTYYEKAVQIDGTNLQDTYQLAVAELEMNPIDKNGLWYVAKAIQLGKAMKNDQAVTSMVAYGGGKYRKYHGGDDGWDQMVSDAAGQAAPPTNFAASIKPAPTPCDLAVQAVQQNDVNEFSFSDWEFILSKRDCSPANGEAAKKVWDALQAKQKGGTARLQISVMVISTTANSIAGAMTDENKGAKKADIRVSLAKAVATPPRPGREITVIGVISSYTANPFLFVMTQGEIK